MNSDKAIYIFINGTLPPTAAQMSLIYDEHKDEDVKYYKILSSYYHFLIT